MHGMNIKIHILSVSLVWGCSTVAVEGALWLTVGWMCLVLTVSHKQFNLPYAIEASQSVQFILLEGVAPCESISLTRDRCLGLK